MTSPRPSPSTGSGAQLRRYDAILCRALRSVIDLDRLVRVAYFGFPSTLALLGAFSVGLERTPNGLEAQVPAWKMCGLIAVAFAFHVFSYVQNDLIDLPIDRTQPKRARDPLVRGAIRPAQALVLALIQVPLAGLASLWLEAPPLGFLVLLCGFSLMTVYNLYGKRGPWPPLTDLAQAMAWTCLTVYGALVVDPARTSPHWLLVLAVAVFGIGFILLISGVHGGLRDLVNDRAHRVNTTALFLGADTNEATGGAISSSKTRAYAHAIHAAMFALPSLIVLDPVRDGFTAGLGLGRVERTYLAVLIVLVFLSSRWVLARVVRAHEPRRDRWISTWGPVVMQAPLLAFAPCLGATSLTVMLVAFYVPLLTTRQFLTGVVRYTHPSIAGHVEDPASRPARARPA